jgi:glycosyltransferase involved in cell wall biosynthesis
MRRSLDVIRDVARVVVTSSQASKRDLEACGIEPARIRVVPLGVDHAPASAADVAAVRQRYQLPARFVLFLGTHEPRKNLRRLAAAVPRASGGLPLVIAGLAGWGDATAGIGDAARFLGVVPAADLPALYAAATVFAYPSEAEGFGLPVLEAMAQGTPVVTSRGTSTEEVAGGAAVLVDPFDVDAIAAGLDEATCRGDELAGAGRRRAATMTWEAAAQRTMAVYGEVLT